jgi:hypothetical protein
LDGDDARSEFSDISDDDLRKNGHEYMFDSILNDSPQEILINSPNPHIAPVQQYPLIPAPMRQQQQQGKMTQIKNIV